MNMQVLGLMRKSQQDKAQTRPERRTPPLRETHEGRQMKGDKAQTRPERRTPPVTKRRRHLKKELRTSNSKLFGEKSTLDGHWMCIPSGTSWHGYWKWPIEIFDKNPLIAWWFSSSLCHKLPEGINIAKHSITHQPSAKYTYHCSYHCSDPNLTENATSKIHGQYGKTVGIYDINIVI